MRSYVLKWLIVNSTASPWNPPTIRHLYRVRFWDTSIHWMLILNWSAWYVNWIICSYLVVLCFNWVKHAIYRASKWKQKEDEIKPVKLPLMRPTFNRSPIWAGRAVLNSLCHFPSPSGHRGSRSRCVKTNGHFDNTTSLWVALPPCFRY